MGWAQSSRSTPSAEIERTIAWSFAATRLGQLAFSAAMIASDRRRYRSPRLQLALFLAVTAESIWLVRRLVRAGAYTDTTARWVDTLTAATGLAVCEAGLGEDGAPWVKNVVIGAALGAASANGSLEASGAVATLAAAAVATGVRAGGRDRHVAGLGLAVNDSLSWVGMHAAARAYVTAHRRYAELREEAEAVALERAAETAAELERRRQHDRLHHRTVQTLRQLTAAGDPVTAGLLARQEAARLRHALRTQGEVPGDLDQALFDAIEAGHRSGVRTELVAAELDRATVGPEAAAALGAAVQEALLAAAEHGAAGRAVIRAVSEEGTVQVTVRDHGTGFVPGTGSAHEGRLTAAIEGLRATGGSGAARSDPERGTRLVLSVPSVAQGGTHQPVDDRPGVGTRRPPAGDDDLVLGDGDVDRSGARGLLTAVQAEVGVAGTDHLTAGGARQALQAGAQQGRLGQDADRRESHVPSVAGPPPAVVGHPAPFGDERERADRVMRTAFLTWRATGLLTGLAAVTAGLDRHRHPALAIGPLVGATVESLWFGHRLLRARLWADPAGAAADAGTAVAVLASSRVSLARRDRWTWINWAPWSFASNVVAGQAMGAGDLRRGAAGAAAVTVANALLDPAAGFAGAATGAMAAFFAVGGFFARQLRRGAEHLEQAQQAAVTAGAELAAERERLVQLRLLHDGAVQTLEAVGSGRVGDLDAVRALAGREAERLLVELGAGGRPGSRLGDALRRVADEQRAGGLAATVDLAPVTEPPPEVVAALGAAVGEALTNVRKHAGTAAAEVSVRGREDGGVVVCVEDRGRGFDPTVRTPGFGLSESIDRRIAEAGGRSSVRSAPGDGTRVTLEWPA